MSDENNTPGGTSRSGTAFELEASRAALAIALIRFLDLTGGADGMSTGRGDPRVVRGMALAALDRAGFAYATTSKELDPLPGLDDAEAERRKGTLHAGGIRTPGFVSDPSSESRDPRDDWMNSGGRIKPVAIVTADMAPRKDR